MKFLRTWWRVWVPLAAVVGMYLFVTRDRSCAFTRDRYGLRLSRCPDGEVRQTAWARAASLQRGLPGRVEVGAFAHYVFEHSEYPGSEAMPQVTASLALVNPSGKETPLQPDQAWKGTSVQEALVTLPAVPDGDYLLRATAKTRLGTDHVDLALPLYAPAQIHVITDRPLYRAGDLIKFRAVALRARDLHPLAGRLGHWEVHDPSGELLLEEKAPAGQWGVVAGTFPLDAQAATGDWKVAWVSGAARDEVTVRVEPFVMPRFRLEAHAVEPFYRANQKPVVKGSVVYSSGAPVAKSRLAVTWVLHGAWPPPRDWLEQKLPKAAETDAEGHFTLNLPEVPADLQGQVTLSARLAATDASGDRVEGQASVLLTEDAIQVSTVTELENGLVEGFNNRLFLRATTAAGEVLPGVELNLKRTWEPGDPGLKAQTDEDGVAQVQIDPGPAVNVVIPPAPYRPEPLPPVVQRTGFDELLSEGSEPSLAELRSADGWEGALAACARYTDDPASASVVARVDSSGALRAVAAIPENAEADAEGDDADQDAPGGTGRLLACVTQVAREHHLAPGIERLVRLTWQFSSQGIPRFETTVTSPAGLPKGLTWGLHDAAQEARRCLPLHATSSNLRRMISWSVRAHSREVALSWIADPNGDSPEAITDCVVRSISSLKLSAEPSRDYLGVARFAVVEPEAESEDRPQPTILQGYELTVSAHRGNVDLGHTLVRLHPGSVPPLRLRATPTLAKPGDTLQVELIRGPDFEGELPEEVEILSDDVQAHVKLDPLTRKASFKLPPAVKGWVEVEGGGVRGLVYVRSDTQLEVALTSDKERYAPGETARLGIETRLGGQGAPAAVGLIGVDNSLAQLATLPGPDDMARIRPKVSTPTPAFGTLDGQALTMGRIRGINAAAATVLQVSGRPLLAAVDSPVSAASDQTFDPVAPLTDHFYELLAQLHREAQAWEEKAPPEEKMHPPTMAKLWTQALADAKARGIPVDDAFGRDLRLRELPPDLLALTDPRAVIAQGTRLPEDVENWAAYVAKEQP